MSRGAASGTMSIRSGSLSVGPGIAVHLDIPQIVFVRNIRDLSDKAIVAERMFEGGFEVVESTLPVLLTVVKDINEPRLPSLRGKMMAKKAEIPVWGMKDIDVEEGRIGLKGSPTWVDKVFTPPPRSGGQVFEGETGDIVQSFIDALKKDELIP